MTDSFFLYFFDTNLCLYPYHIVRILSERFNPYNRQFCNTKKLPIILIVMKGVFA